MARELGLLPHEYLERVTPSQHRAYLTYWLRPSREHRYSAMIAYNVIRPHLKDPGNVSPDDFLIGGKDTGRDRDHGPDGPHESTSFSQGQSRDDDLTEEEKRSRATYLSKLRWARVMGRNMDGSIRQ